MRGRVNNNLASKSTLGVSLISLIGANATGFLKSQDESKKAEVKRNIINKSIKIYEPVYKLFDEVCKSYPNYKKQDLISIALLEFCNKHKK